MVTLQEKRKRWRRREMWCLKDLAREVKEAGLTEAFKDYLIERFYIDHKKAELPDSAKEICRILAIEYGWGITDTYIYLCDFATTAGLLPELEDEESTESVVPAHDWQAEGF